MESVTSVMWFRRDLRLHDQPALAAALERGPVAPLFVIDDRLIHGRWPSPNRVAFMLESLASLRAELTARGGRLHVRVGRPEVEVPRFALEAGAIDVFASRDYSPYARRRDRRVAEALGGAGVAFHARRGVLVHEPEDIRKDDGTPFAVFTPFLRRWSALDRRAVLEAPAQIPGVRLEMGDIPSMQDLGMREPQAKLPAAGEPAARRRLIDWERDGVAGYADGRDLLGEARTSRLSQDLRWGLLSPLEVVERCASSPKFVSEVAWREFYYHILWHHPRIIREPFQPQYAALEWAIDQGSLAAWKAGRTGYPVVDAAMRELLATGYMHNRARMIAASFLTKDLLINWREGERHFMEHLVDGDLANNNGGWQWAASTGTDAQPYFRIFNAYSQGAKFDGDGQYVRRWVPELRNVPDAYLQQPHTMPMDVQRSAGCMIGGDYPAPIVDHAAARERALAVYGAARGRATGSR